MLDEDGLPSPGLFLKPSYLVNEAIQTLDLAGTKQIVRRQSFIHEKGNYLEFLEVTMATN